MRPPALPFLALLALPVLLAPGRSAAQQGDLPGILREEQSILAALDRHVFEARRAEAALRAAESAKGTAEARAAAARQVMEQAMRDQAVAAGRLRDTLRLMAAAAPYGTAVAMLLAPEGDEVCRRNALMARIAARQAREVEALAAAADAAVAAEFRAGIERANAHAVAAAEREARERLEVETGERLKLLAALEKDRALAMRHAQELTAVERALAAEIEQKLSRRAAPVPFESLRGRMRNPMADSRVEVPFGDRIHPVFRTATPHPGLTLRHSGPVRNVRAVAFGRVVHVGPVRGLGNTVVLDHASGWYTVYAGLADVSVTVDAVVREGDLLGRAERAPGDDATRMYFELRRGPVAVDPAPFLARGKGQ